MPKLENKSENKIEKIRHSLSHLLAMAVLELYPKVKLGIGPAIENGFYYDFDFNKIINPKPHFCKAKLARIIPNSKQIQNSKSQNSKQEFKLTPEMLPELEKRMRELIKQNLEFQKKIISPLEAKKIFKDQPYKLELIKELQKAKQKISIYETKPKTLSRKDISRSETNSKLQTKFIDLCAGPHVKNTAEIDPESFKLTKIAGAYWQGDEKNPMLTRIYGIAFESKQKLDEYLKLLEESEKRNHVVLGQKLELFMVSEEVGQGLPLWLPNGALIRQIIEDFIIQKYLQNGYKLVRTPHIGSEKLFSISGHLNFYKNAMYAPVEIEKEKYYLKPMNCPMHLMIYKNSPKSYRDLPIRYAELGTVYRYEKSGVLHGLTRVRGFTQDDGHIICRKDQLEGEIEKAIELTKNILNTFGFKDFRVALSVRDPKNKKKYLGSDAMWEKSEKALAKGIKKAGWQFEREEGEAVFYGPKMDIKAKDSLGREWQISTLQIDFNLPERFDIYFINENSKKERPFMLHRALLGSLERFTGLLIEHYNGAFPLWLAPIQVEIITVGSRHQDYARKIYSQLLENNIRASISDENLTVSKRIREAELKKIPYLLVVGDKELANSSVNVRSLKKGILGNIKFETFLKNLLEEIKEKK